jgi:hypothetical protein
VTREIAQMSRRDAGFMDTLKAVASSFFGVRGGRAHRQDMSRLNPVHVIVVGILLAAAFVVTLLLVVNAVVG